MARESIEESLVRWKELDVLRQHYAEFLPFLEDAMAFLGFSTTDIQADIASFLQYGPAYLMVQAQRGQAKTTITACFAVWCLIHDPKFRVLIVSAGGTQASEISTLIVRLIMNMVELECLRPDRNNGDRTSVEAFDVHYALKGVDKSPSIACVGIGGNLPGKRADLLIADDIESPKNSATAVQRAQLLELTKEFSSICSTGRIVYLGTPQSMESIYNVLPSRGFVVRIWPGRYPGAEQREAYGDMLAPLIARRMNEDSTLPTGGGILADQGQPVDPAILNEDQLQFKERDQGPSTFQLQFMLNTRLLDALRYPLKTENLVMLRMGVGQPLPVKLVRGFGGASLARMSIETYSFGISKPHDVSTETAPAQGIVMYVDPAGGGKNADETAYAIVAFLHGNVFLLAWGGVPGGYATSGLERLAKEAARWKVNRVIVEKNMGYGAFKEVWTPLLRQHWTCAIDDDLVGPKQKELRIIELIEPVLARGSLVINEAGIQEEIESIKQYSNERRLTYSLMFQMAKITRDRGALLHDDRIDALAGAIAYWVPYLTKDQRKELEALQKKAHEERIKDPLGHHRYDKRPGVASVSNSLFRKRIKR